MLNADTIGPGAGAWVPCQASAGSGSKALVLGVPEVGAAVSGKVVLRLDDDGSFEVDSPMTVNDGLEAGTVVGFVELDKERRFAIS